MSAPRARPFIHTFTSPPTRRSLAGAPIAFILISTSSVHPSRLRLALAARLASPGLPPHSAARRRARDARPRPPSSPSSRASRPPWRFARRARASRRAPPAPSSSPRAPTRSNKSIVRRLYREVWNNADLASANASAERYVSDDHVLIDPSNPTPEPGVEAYMQHVRGKSRGAAGLRHSGG